jgi:hypothetical protein
VIQPEGTVEERMYCDEWTVLDLGDGPLFMHPDTLVSVFKLAREIEQGDRVEVLGAKWRKPKAFWTEIREGVKIKRTCPGGTYHAGPSKVRLHNMKTQ